MKNGLSACALSEFVNEVKDDPNEAHAKYGVTVQWTTGTRCTAKTDPMVVGTHRVARAFSWCIDEPRQILGTNQGANPQEYLLSALASCLTVAFVTGATTRGIQIEKIETKVTAQLDLRGFLGTNENIPPRFLSVDYAMFVCADATESALVDLLEYAEKHSPNADLISRATTLTGRLEKAKLADA